MGDVGTSLTVALGAARQEAIDGATTAGDATACRVLGELLGLDAAWILDAGGPPAVVLARWEREGLRPHRLGAARIASLLSECPGGCTGRRDGRYAVIVAPIEAGGERVGTLVGSVRSAHEFSAAELAAAELIAAGAAAGLAGPVTPPPARPNGAAMRPLEHLEMLHSLSVRLAHTFRSLNSACSPAASSSTAGRSVG